MNMITHLLNMLKHIQMLKLYVQKMVMGYLHKDPQNILEVKDVQIVE